MRILHVIPSLSLATGGPAVNTVALCREMNRLGHSSLVATTELVTPAQAVRIQDGAIVADFPPGSEDLEIHVFPVRFPRRLAYAPELFSFLRQTVSAVDVVHIHSVNLFTQYAAWRSSDKRRSAIRAVSARGS